MTVPYTMTVPHMSLRTPWRRITTAFQQVGELLGCCSWRIDDGPRRYVEAERLLAVANRYSSGVTYGQEWTLILTAA